MSAGEEKSSCCCGEKASAEEAETFGCGCNHEHHEHDNKHEHAEKSCCCGHEHHHDEKECGCGCGHEHHHEEECGCGHEHHNHDEECGCGCGCGHEHKHEEECGCGCNHEHKHEEECDRGCGHEHKHEEECDCGCGHEHHHDGCGCGCCDDDDDEDGCCCCCGGHVDVSKVPEKGLTDKQKKKLATVLIALAALLIVKLAEPLIATLPGSASYFTNVILYGIIYLFVGHKVLRRAAKNIAKGKVFDENFLMVVATLGAIFMGLLGDGEFTEAAAVMIFYQLGEWFEDYAVGRSRKNITDLMDIRPDYANVEIDGKLEQVDPASLPVGSIFVVQPGEKIPLDGVVVEGKSSLDTSALTGESVPRNAGVGDDVISGCICSSGVLKIKSTKIFAESTVSKILKLVENASDRKSHSEAFITRFAKYYTPIVCYAALALAILPPLFLTFAGQGADWLDWIYRALTFLIISCPCALVISVPLSFFAGIGCASKNGVLVKGSNYLEALSSIETVVFDKTGTLTQGVFKVVDVDLANVEILESIDVEETLSEGHDFDDAQRKVLVLAAYAESASSHPIAKSIVASVKEELDRNKLANVLEVSAQGVSAEVSGHSVKVGKFSFVSEDGTAASASKHGTIVHVSVDGHLVGTISIADVVKETSAQAISEIKAEGVAKTVMLTGDNEDAAKFVADQIGIDEVHANLLPENKVERVEQIKNSIENEKRYVAFVGDGINDAPVLMRADVGIAMGAMGSDAAIEAADVVLMDDNPLSIAKSVKISRKSMRIVRENIVFSLTVKALCLILGAIGLATMYLAIFADVGVMIIAVLNAMRCLRIKA